MRILVTGGHGFLGSRVVKALAGDDVIAPLHADCDLTDRAAVRRLFEHVRPEVVVHLAARVGGIGANQAQPATFFTENLLMGVHVLDESRGCARFLATATVCSYPSHGPVPFREADIWNGYPEETNAPYGIAKRTLITGARAYRQQHGLRATILLPTNLYGPGDDPDLATSHVVPAIIAKMRANPEEITLWGDGTPTRELLFVDDCAEAIARAARFEGELPEAMNLGSGEEISIRALAEKIAGLLGWSGRIRWDATRPNGQMRRLVEGSRANEFLGWRATTPLDDGLRQTIFV